MNAKQIKNLKWHKNCMITAMRTEGINLDEIDENLDNIIEMIDDDRIQSADKVRMSGYRAGYTDGQFIGYNDGWEKAKLKFER